REVERARVGAPGEARHLQVEVGRQVGERPAPAVVDHEVPAVGLETGARLAAERDARAVRAVARTAVVAGALRDLPRAAPAGSPPANPPSGRPGAPRWPPGRPGRRAGPRACPASGRARRCRPWARP